MTMVKPKIEPKIDAKGRLVFGSVSDAMENFRRELALRPLAQLKPGGGRVQISKHTR